MLVSGMVLLSTQEINTMKTRCLLVSLGKERIEEIPVCSMIRHRLSFLWELARQIMFRKE